MPYNNATKLSIWGDVIPYNSNKSKLDDLEVHTEYTYEEIFTKHPGIFASQEAFVEDLSGNETMVYREEILPGHARETYEDKPYLIPYLVPQSDTCVIICPGGGYLLKSMDNEGSEVARFLNEAGISCFVLWYRSYPYREPVMFRDCQRAIRYVRHHAKKFEVDPHKIGLLGFSAGGNLAGTTVTLFGNKSMEAPNYIPDSIDAESAEVQALGLIYPAVSFEDAQVFLECIVPKDRVRDPKTRMELAHTYTLKNHVDPQHPPCFLCASNDDNLIPVKYLSDYAKVLHDTKIPYELHLLQKGGHGFGACTVKSHPELDEESLRHAAQWKNLYIKWLKGIFSKDLPKNNEQNDKKNTKTKQAYNPYLPSWEYIPDGEPRVFGNRVYVYGSHDTFNGHAYCLGDYVSWSAPVDNLADWRYEGVIYTAEDVENNSDRDSCLYAPDVVQGPDGRYYLYYVDSKRSQVSVAVCSEPAGRYRFYAYVQDKDGKILGNRPGDEAQFDPAVLVENDKVYLYTGFCAPGDTSRHGAMLTILKSDMCTIAHETVFVLPSQPYSKDTGYEGHEFFEAPSIRKRNGLYYLVYSSVAMHELCYATSKYPDRDFTYKGVIVSNADLGITSYKAAEQTMYYGANNHGGMAEINGAWYIFYHRHTNGHQYSRQGCIEKITFLADGRIPQVEITSCGANQGPLRGEGEYPGYLACHLFCKEASLYTDCTSAWMDSQFPKITQDSNNTDKKPGYLANMKDGATAGFKYFDCKAISQISIRVRGYCLGAFDVHLSWNGPTIASIPVHFSNSWQEYSCPINIPDGIHSLYFTYRGQGSAQLASFRLAI